MNRIQKIPIFALAAIAPIAAADNLAGKNQLLCSAVQVTVCSIDGFCESGLPWEWEVPQFLEINLDKKTISTTEASGENRSSPLRSLERKEGLIILQGIENGRAFSAVLNEEFGDGTFSVARDGITISAFAACTPMDKK